MKFLFSLAALLVVACVASSDESVTRYDGYTVHRLLPSSAFQLDFLQQLSEEAGIDYWREPDAINRNADIMLAPEVKDKFLALIEKHGIDHQLMVHDVQQRIDAERQDQLRSLVDQPLLRGLEGRAGEEAISGFWNSYQRYGQHLNLVDALVSAGGAIASKITIGKSYQGKDLVALRLGVNGGASTAKKAIWIEGGIHAREWVSPATVSYFAQQLVNGYKDGTADVVDLLTYFDFYFVFVLNADGYEYTHTNSRLWRKTRRPSASSPSCIGADPNRNFGYEWGGQGASTNPCSETYRGDKAFSEPEVKAETDWILANLKGKIVSFLSVHSYGQYWLYPWGYTSAVTPDNTELNRVAKAAVKALNQVTPSTKYTIGTSTNVLYAAAGGADDWSYGSAKATYSYTVELRDTGTYGFQLPASQIKATGAETSAAFLALAKEIKAKLG